MERAYQICTRCVMDTTVPDITFDSQGICNFCRRYEDRIAREVHHDQSGQARLMSMISKIKREGQGKDYDCVIGVSGGTDSTFVAYLVKKKFGLRPLAVHVDNGWNAEFAVHNIERALQYLDIDLHKIVPDWEEFIDIQLSFLKSSISNIEIPTDHAIHAILFRKAASIGVRYIISGSNLVTEAIMPSSWMYYAQDARIIKGIHKQFGKNNLRSFPLLSPLELAYYVGIKKIIWFPILNYVPHRKDDVEQLLHDVLGWCAYDGKHHESFFTRFFQTYYLPVKFNIDKRKAHLSCLIMSGQITRDQALAELSKPPYSPEHLEEDIAFFLSKLNLSDEEFQSIMNAPAKSYRDYPNNSLLWDSIVSIVRMARKKKIGHW